MVWVAFLHLIPPAIAMVALIGSNIEPASVYDNEPTGVTAGNTWSAQELGTMALGQTMTAVVSGTGGADLGGSGTQLFSSERAEGLADQVSVAHLRGIILAETSNAKGGMQNNIANFASTDDPAATCATADTAGWGGIDLCTSQCRSKRSAVLRKTPHERSCRLLCALAVDPCDKMLEKNSSWTSRMMKNWTDNLAAMLATVERAKATASTKDDEVRSSLYIFLGLLFLMVVFMLYSSSDLSKLMSGVRRVEKDRASTQGQVAAVRRKRAFQPRKARASPESLFHDDGVAPEICRAIAAAKGEFARRGTACSLLVEGLLFRREKACMVARFGRWKREAAAAGVKEVAADVVGDGEESKAESAGGGW